MYKTFKADNRPNKSRVAIHKFINLVKSLNKIENSYKNTLSN